MSGEPTAAMKLTRLKKWITQNKLDGHKLLGVLDLRKTRTAEAPQEELIR